MILENSISRYYPQLQEVQKRLAGRQPEADLPERNPGFDLPALTPQVRNFFSVSDLAHVPMGRYQGYGLSLLDLRRNPGTGTAQTFPALVTVARAVRFIQDTGLPLTILMPASANTAVALRDAVLRAIQIGLVGPHQLNVVVLVSATSAHKIRASTLSEDPYLRARNPVAVYGGADLAIGEDICAAVTDRYRTSLREDSTTHLWQPVALADRVAGGVVRALAEAEFFPPAPGPGRLQAQVVSSGSGLLGHALGRELLAGKPGTHNGYLLIQQLGGADLVPGLYGDDRADPDPGPAYTYDAEEGVYTQDVNPRFPQATFDPAEAPDSTFRRHQPPTSGLVMELIRTHGSGGIVVSFAECLIRYRSMRPMLTEAGLPVPENSPDVLEWSAIMTLTGVLNAIDRGLVRERDIVLHSTGLYSRSDVAPLASPSLHPVHDAESVRDLLLKTAR